LGKKEERSQSYCLDTVINTWRRGQVEFLKYRYMDLEYGLPWASHASIYLPDDREYMEIMIMINCHILVPKATLLHDATSTFLFFGRQNVPQ
jgi:hypothetical protein